MAKEWQQAAIDLKAAKRISKSLDLCEPMGRLLIARGLKTAKAVKGWLAPELSALGPLESMTGLIPAAETIIKAIEVKDKIVVFGDFDVDGVTSTAVLLNMLEAMGAAVEAVIPDRRLDGYGLSAALVRRIAEAGAKLLVTVDCGITNNSETALAKELGLNVIIVDHHEPAPELPPADIIVNPRQPACKYGFKDLAAVGLAFRLAQALGARAGLEDLAAGQLDLVALGTIADVVPLVGENRILAFHGLKQMTAGARTGLKELIDVSGLGEAPLSAGQIGFGLAPRLNAAGRLESARAGLDLLRANNVDAARKLAGELDRLNTERRRVEEKMLEEAVEAVESEALGCAIVLASPDWHEGVKGIVASRLVERYFRPTVLCSMKDGKYVGSARSVPGLNLFAALERCSDLLDRWGGHRGAAGLTVAEKNWQAFREKFAQVVEETIEEGGFIERLNVDLELSPEDVSDRFTKELELLAPFGRGNPTPVFSLRNIYADDYRELSGGRHLRFLAQAGSMTAEAVAFRVDKESILAGRESMLDLALQLGHNHFRGRVNLQLKVVDARSAVRPEVERTATIRLAQTEQGFFLPDEESLSASGASLSFIDKRGSGEKDRLLREFLDSGLPATLYVLDEHEGVHLANRLEKNGSDRGGELEIICGPQDGSVDTGRLIFYQAPLSARAFAALCDAGRKRERKVVYLLYEDEDIATARHVVDSLCPSRERLADIYRLLRDAGPLDLSEAAFLVRQELGEKLYPPATRQGTGRIFKVLVELGLLAREEGDRFAVTPGRAKVDLERSPSWLKMSSQKAEAELFLRLAMTAHPARLAHPVASR